MSDALEQTSDTPLAPNANPRPAHASKHTDLWTWHAVHADGAVVSEMDAEGYDAHAMADVDVPRCVAFVLEPLRDGLPQPQVQIDVAKGQRVIFTRRRSITINPNTGQVVGRKTIHLLGFQQTVGGRNVKCLTYWFDDGSCLLSDDDQLSF